MHGLQKRPQHLQQLEQALAGRSMELPAVRKLTRHDLPATLGRAVVALGTALRGQHNLLTSVWPAKIRPRSCALARCSSHPSDLQEVLPMHASRCRSTQTVSMLHSEVAGRTQPRAADCALARCHWECGLRAQHSWCVKHKPTSAQVVALVPPWR